MRIQHNIMAMSAYRNYTNNVSAMKKNLEKLSSGYKINRAGDDAAGLAISEKMRAQITGLETAQKNAKDGISLVQTAEGALTEVHDMLNRMVELATQSANGTYDNTTDRNQMQKEVNQLLSEINRIADSANFNGINLLDGSMEKLDAMSATSETVNVSGMDRILKTVIGKDDKAYEVNTAKTVLDSWPGSATRAVFTIDLSKLENGTIVDGNKFEGAAATVSGAELGTMQITLGGDVTLKADFTYQSDAEIKISASGTVDHTAVDASKWAKAFIQTAEASAGASNTLVELNGVKWKMTASGSTLKFEQLTEPSTASKGKANFSVDVKYTAGPKGVLNYDLYGNTPNGTTVEKVGIPKGGAKGADTIFEIKEGDIQDGTKITLGQGSTVQTITFKVGPNSSVQGSGSSGNWVIDLSDIEPGEVDLHIALSRLSAKVSGSDIKLKAKSDGTSIVFKLGVSDGGNGPAGITLIRATAPATGVGTSPSSVQFNTLEKLANNFKMSYTKTTPAQEARNGLKLQIGDTADAYNQLEVSIKDMHAKSLGLDSISIADQDSAQAAVKAIKDAINMVSDVRGTLGATQNRLDHTINNLSVMTENIQDAESTIRDTDVAAEMMAYTKNNILIQSAQAMLAQANQVPQGVLQLLS